MVTSIQVVPLTEKVRREKEHEVYTPSQKDSSSSSFQEILNQTIEEPKNASLNCCNTTYGRDCKLQTFLYQSREYTF